MKGRVTAEALPELLAELRFGRDDLRYDVSETEAYARTWLAGIAAGRRAAVPPDLARAFGNAATRLSAEFGFWPACLTAQEVAELMTDGLAP